MIPDFLRRENRSKEAEINEMDISIENYEKHFGKGLNTEPSTWSEKEWVEIIKICIEKNKTIDELLGIEHEPDDDD